MDPSSVNPRTRAVALHVLTRLVLGGPSRPVASLLSRLKERGIDTFLVSGRPGIDEVPMPADGRTVLVPLPDLVREPSPARDVRALVQLVRIIRRVAPAVVHTHTAKAGALARVAARLARTGATVVHTFHGHSLDPAASGRLAPAWRAIERTLARAATDLAIALSPGQRDDLAARLGGGISGRLAVIPLGLAVEDYPAADPREEERFRRASPDGRHATRAHFVFVGRGVRVKGLDVLAAAWRTLADSGRADGLRVTIVGPVEQGVRSAVERLLGGAPGWTFFGPSANPLPLVAAADAVVLPSLSEGTPVSILEALLLGRPVVASRVGGVPDLLGAGWVREGAGEWGLVPSAPRGLLLPPGDAAAWAAALSGAAENPASVPGDPLERRAFARATFDADARADDIAALYARTGALDGHPRRKE